MVRRGVVVQVAEAVVTVKIEEPGGDHWDREFPIRNEAGYGVKVGDRVVWWPAWKGSWAPDWPKVMRLDGMMRLVREDDLSEEEAAGVDASLADERESQRKQAEYRKMLEEQFGEL